MFALNVQLPSLEKDIADEITKTIRVLEDAGEEGPFYGGVMSDGEAAAYALVWEWGNARQTQKGPKTTLGLNPDGSQVWLSIQAPFGFIAISSGDYLRILENEIDAMSFGKWTEKEILQAMKRVSKRAAELMASVIAENAPVDTGALRESIKAMHPDDPELKSLDEDMELGD